MRMELLRLAIHQHKRINQLNIITSKRIFLYVSNRLFLRSEPRRRLLRLLYARTWDYATIIICHWQWQCAYSHLAQFRCKCKFLRLPLVSFPIHPINFYRFFFFSDKTSQQQNPHCKVELVVSVDGNLWHSFRPSNHQTVLLQNNGFIWCIEAENDNKINSLKFIFQFCFRLLRQRRSLFFFCLVLGPNGMVFPLMTVLTVFSLSINLALQQSLMKSQMVNRFPIFFFFRIHRDIWI